MIEQPARIHQKSADVAIAGDRIAELRRSQSCALLLDDAVVCVWGIQAASILANSAYVWLLTSRAVDEHPMLFLRQSKRMREAMLAEYGTIEGVVAIDNQGTLYVANSGTPYPAAAIADDPSAGGTITFDGWNEPVTLTAPADAVALPSSG